MKNTHFFLLLPLLCVACSADTTKVEVSDTSTTVAVEKEEVSVSAIDEKNGFRTYHFGDDISSFPDLEPVVSYGPPSIKEYKMPASKENYQVGDTKLADIIYSFYKDKFYSVLAHADRLDKDALTKLTSAVTALYGAGKGFSSGSGTGWYGDKVNGSVSVEGRDYRITQFRLTSKVIEKQIEADKLGSNKKGASDL